MNKNVRFLRDINNKMVNGPNSKTTIVESVLFQKPQTFDTLMGVVESHLQIVTIWICSLQREFHIPCRQMMELIFITTGK